MPFEGEVILTSVPDNDSSSEGTNAGIKAITDPEIPIPASEEVPVRETLEEAPSIAGQWEEEKKAVSLLDPISNVVDRVKIFFASKAIERATKKHERLAVLLTVQEKKGYEIEAAIEGSKRAGEALDAIRQSSGLGRPSQEWDMLRRGQIKSSEEKLDVIGGNLQALDLKIYQAEQKRQAFESARSAAKERIIGRFQAKIDQEQTAITRFNDNIALVDGAIREVRGEIVTLQENRRQLNELMTASLLPEFAREMRKTDQLLALKIRQVEQKQLQHERRKEVLFTQRAGAEGRKAQWEAKIAPPKPKEALVEVAPIQTEAPGVEDVVSKEASREVESEASEVVTTPTPEQVSFPQAPEVVREPSNDSALSGISQERGEKKPNSLIESVLGFRRELNTMSPEERADFDTAIDTTRKVFEKRYPDSGVFKWFIWILEFVMGTDKEPSAIKEK